MFRAYGQYGSTVWDPMTYVTENYLELTICDLCLARHCERVRVVTVTPVAPQVEYRPWDPNDPS